MISGHVSLEIKTTKFVELEEQGKLRQEFSNLKATLGTEMRENSFVTQDSAFHCLPRKADGGSL